MHKVYFVIGLVCGIIITVAFTMTLPLYMDFNRHNVEMNLGKQQSQTIITIGWNPNVKGTCAAAGSLYNTPLNQHVAWNEYWMVSYKDKEEVIKARNKLLKAIGKENASISSDGQ